MKTSASLLLLSGLVLGLGFEFLSTGAALAATALLVFLNWRASK